MTGLSTSPALRSFSVTGLRSTTALTLSLLGLLAVADPAHAQQTVTFDQPPRDWNTTDTNWDGSITGNNSTFANGDFVIFDSYGNTVTLTETVAPGSILFTNDNSPSTIETDPGPFTLSTDSGAGGTLTIDHDDPDDLLTINVNITGTNPVNFNSLAPTPGTIRMNGDIAPNVQVSNGTFNFNGTASGDAALSAGAFNLLSPASVVGTTNVTGGTFTNGGDAGSGGGLLGAVNISGTDGANLGTLVNQGTADMTGLTTVSDFGVLTNGGNMAALDVTGGAVTNQGSGDITGAVNISGGTVENNGEIGTIATSGPVAVTGGTLDNNASAFVRGDLTIGSNTVVADQGGIVNGDGGTFGAVEVQTGGQLNINAVTVAEVDVTGGSALIDNELQGTLDVTAGTAIVTAEGADPVADPGGSVTGAATVSGGSLTVAGDLDAGVTVSDTTPTDFGTLTVQSTGDVLGTTTVTGIGVVINGGDIDVLDMQGGAFENQRSGDINGNLTMSGGVLTNFGDLGDNAADTVTITGGTLTNTSSIDGVGSLRRGDVRGDVTIGSNTVVADQGGIVNADGGIFANIDVQTGGQLNVTGLTDATVTVSGGSASVRNALTGTLDVSAGDASITATGADPVAVPGGSVSGLATVSGGTLAVAGDLDGGATVSGATNLAFGTLNVQGAGEVGGTTTLTGFGIVTNAGDVAALDMQDGTFNNQTSGEITGTADISGGTLTNAGDITGAVNISGGTVINNDEIGTATTSGPVAVTGGTLTNNTGAFVRGDLTIGSNTVVADQGGIVNGEGGTFGAVDVQTGGQLNVNADSTANVTVSGGTADVDAVLTGTLDVTAGAANIATTGAITGAVDISGGAVENDGQIGTTTAAGPVTVTGGTLDNNTGAFVRGDLTIGSNTVVADQGGIVNGEGGTFGAVDVQTGGQLNINGVTDADLTVSGGSALVANTLTGTLDVSDGTAAITAAGAVNGLATVSGGILTNAGDLNLGATVSGTSTTDVGTLNIQSGATVAGTTTVADFGAVANSGEVAALNVQGGTFTNQNAGDVTGAINVTGGVLDNTGELGTLAASGPVSVSGGALNNNVGGNIVQTVTLTNTGTLNINGGTFSGGINAIGGALNINTGVTQDITNTGTTIRINSLVGGVDPVPTQTGTLTGTIDNVSGTIETFAGANVSGQVTLRAGSLTSDGGTYTVGVDVLGGTATITGDTTMGLLENTGGGVSTQAGATLTATVINGGTGTITNAGIIDGTLDIQGGTVTQTGATAQVTDQVQVGATGTLNASGGTFDTEVRATGGTVNITGPVTGDIRNLGAGEVAITAPGTLTGTLTAQAGTFRVAGTLDGALDVTRATGVVTGIVEQGATVNGSAGAGTLITRGTSAVIRGATSVTNGRLLAEGGTFSGGATLNTGADMQVSGRIGGAVTNAAGAITVTTTGDVAGTLSQTGGTADISGLISGTANITGGTLTSQTGSQFSNAVTVDGGTLDSNGGTFTGGIDGTSGTVNVLGATTGDIRNTGANVTIASTGTVTGDVTHTGGSTTNNGTIGGALNVQGDTVTQAAGTVTGLTTVSGAGTLIASGGALTGGVLATGGNTRVTGSVSSPSVVNDGGLVDIAAAGTLDGPLTHNSGTTNVAGSVDGLTVAGTGITTVAGSNITGATTVTTGGALIAQGGAFSAPVTNTGGRIDVDGATAANITNTAGLLIIHGGDTLTGNVTNADNMILNGTVAGAVTNADTMTVAAGQTASVTAGLTNALDGTLDVSGSLTADVTNAAGGVFNFTGGTLTGAFDNFGDINATGANTVTGASTNAGDIQIASGSLTITNTFENNSGNTLTIDTGTSFAATETTNTSTGRIVNNGTLDGALINAGAVETTNGTFSGRVTNADTGTIGGTATGALSFAGGLINNGTVDLTGNAATTDVVTIGGTGLAGNGTFALDLDLSDDIGGTDRGDYIIAAAGSPVTGNINIAFNTVAFGGQQENNIPVLLVDDAAANNFNITASGLPDPGDVVIYSIVQNGANGDVFVADLLNPGIGALAGSIVLTQSLIGSVINRPSSPFVNGLAYEDENPCGFGTWARAIGGSADSSGNITQDGTDQQPLRGEISADFYGLQLGGDFACFNGYYKGWDLAGGAIAGFNEGASTQPVFALDPTGGLSDRVTSITDVDFTQRYAGVYGTAVRDRIALEVQYRLETTDFTANNNGVGGSSGLGLEDSKFSSDSSTFSGSLSYVLNVPNTELSFVPVAGFAYTQIATDPITFEDGTIQVENFDSKVGFLGGTLSRTSFGDDGTSALNQFVTATYYNDFAADPRSVYTPSDGSEVRSLTTQNLGAYAEISAGLNYVKILEVGNGLNAKQFSASLRGDLRRSDQLDSWGVTAQMRLQF